LRSIEHLFDRFRRALTLRGARSFDFGFGGARCDSLLYAAAGG
jgi:hypothetical protein